MRQTGSDISFSGGDELSPAEKKVSDRARKHCPTKTTGAADQITFPGKIETNLMDKKRDHYANEERPPLLHKIRFSKNTDEYAGNVDESFKDIVNYLQLNKNMSLIISGGTNLGLDERADITTVDGPKKDAQALELAVARAKKMINTLIEMGVDAKRLILGDPEMNASPIVTPSKTD